MTKQGIRQEVLAKLKLLEPKAKREQSLALLEMVLQSQAYKKAKVLATYLSLPHEYETSLIINKAIQDGKKLVIPKTYPMGEMVFMAYDPEQLVTTSFGVLEPKSGILVAKSEIDLIHVPGLAFNQAGYRIGYGGGYYDNYLSDYKGDSFSTVFDCQMVEFMEETHDIAVKEVYVNDI